MSLLHVAERPLTVQTSLSSLATAAAEEKDANARARRGLKCILDVGEVMGI